MASSEKPSHHIGAHSSKANHSNLHNPISFESLLIHKNPGLPSGFSCLPGFLRDLPTKPDPATPMV
jgi:hypothetical protein